MYYTLYSSNCFCNYLIGKIMSEKSGIYKITCTENCKVYIGSSKNIYRRWSNHKKLLNKNKHTNQHLQNCWNKYLESNFLFEIEEECEEEILTQREDYYIEKYNCLSPVGFNLKTAYRIKISEETRFKISGENNFMFGKTHSEEVRQKIRVSNIGKKHTEETKQKMSELRIGENNFMFGKKHTEETKQKMSELRIGKKLSEETKQKMSESRIGKYCGENNPMFGKTGENSPIFGQKRSEETKQKMRKPKSKEHKKKLSELKIGKKLSEETKQKMRQARLKYLESKK